MRFLADENIPRAVVEALARQGHDVSTIGHHDRGAGDQQIVARAEREARFLLTFGKDFGEIAFRSVLPPLCGIILLRFVPHSPEDAVAVITTAISMRDSWVGQFAVVERDRLRIGFERRLALEMLRPSSGRTRVRLPAVRPRSTEGGNRMAAAEVLAA